MNIFCTECGSKLTPEERFCSSCGVKIDLPKVVVTLPTPTTTEIKAKTVDQSVKAATSIDVEHSTQVVSTANATGSPIVTNRGLNKVLVAVALAIAVLAGLLVFKKQSPTASESSSPTFASPKQNAALPSTVPSTRVDEQKADASTKSVDPKKILSESMLGNFDAALAQVSAWSDLPKPVGGNKKIARELNGSALKELRAGNAQGAVDLLKQAIAEDASDPELKDNLGYALRVVGDPVESEKQLLLLLSVWPERSTAWINLGESFAASEMQKESTGAFAIGYLLAKSKDKTADALRKFSADTTKPAQAKAAMSALEQLKLAP